MDGAKIFFIPWETNILAPVIRIEFTNSALNYLYIMRESSNIIKNDITIYKWWLDNNVLTTVKFSIVYASFG